MKQTNKNPKRPALWTLGAMLLLAITFASPVAAEPSPPSQEKLPDAQDTAKKLANEAFHRKLDMARDDLVLGALDEAERRLDEINLPTPEGYPQHRLAMMRARIAMERGLGTEALKHLDPIPEEAVPSMDWLLHLKGQAQMMSGQPDKALKTFARLLERSPNNTLGQFTRVNHTLALDAINKSVEALAAYNDLLKRYPEHPRRHAHLYRRAQLMLRLGQTREAGLAMQEVWLLYPWKEEGDKAKQILRQEPLASLKLPIPSVSKLQERAKNLRRFKHWLVAERELQDLMQRVKTDSGHSLTENQIRLELALVRYERQDYTQAIRQLEDLEQRARTRGQGKGLSVDYLRKLQQRAWQRMGESEPAEAILKSRSRKRPAKAANRDLADFYWSTGDYKKARRYFDRAMNPTEKKTWFYAFVLYKSGDYRRALRLMQKVGGVARDQSSYWQARALQNMGDRKRAREGFQRVASTWPLSYYAYQSRNRLIEMNEHEAHQNLANNLSEQGMLASNLSPDENLELSLPLTGETCSIAKPGTADALIDIPERAARIHWRGHEAPPSPEAGAGYGQVPSSATDGARMKAYLHADQHLGGSRQAAAKHSDLFPHLPVSSMLFDIGMESEARHELREVTLEFRGLNAAFRKGARPRANRPMALPYKRWAHYVDHRGSKRKGFWGMTSNASRYPVPRAQADKRALANRQSKIADRRAELAEDLKLAMMEIGDFHFVRKMRQGTGPWWRHDPAGDYQEMWSEAHPRAFPSYVQRYAAKEGLNPYLLWALMTIESAYNPDSVSHADARGLLQVIPKTGGKVAADIGDNAYGPYDLLDPETSIRHGAWYFASLVRKFKGQEPLAIASYNGGPHNIQRWLIHKGHIPLDEFVEEIPFNEARRYTKRVLRALGLFLRLYENTDKLYVGQNLSSNVLVDPRY